MVVVVYSTRVFRCDRVHVDPIDVVVKTHVQTQIVFIAVNIVVGNVGRQIMKGACIFFAPVYKERLDPVCIFTDKTHMA